MEIIIIAIVYSLIRAKHDSFLQEGEWKKYAFIEGTFFAAAFTYILGISVVDYIYLPIIFAIVFSIFFDMFCGLFNAGKLFYFGSGTYDQKVKKVFITPRNFFVFKLVWFTVVYGSYLEFKGLI